MSSLMLIVLVAVLSVALLAQDLLASALAAWVALGVLVAIFTAVSLLGVWRSDRHGGADRTG